MGSDDLFKKKRKLTELKRGTGSKGKPRDLILIVCEGKKTEPQYFHSFGLTNVTIEGIGGDPLTVVEKAIHFEKTEKANKKYFDQVWCVFDRDNFSSHRFNAAISKANSHNIKVAYTNEAFELWYLLHFEFYNTGISRHQYSEKLDKHLKKKYKKNDAEIFDLLKRYGNQTKAIDRAKKLLSYHDDPNPCLNNPTTKVHELVIELNKWSK